MLRTIPVTSNNDTFLYDLYVSTRQAEMDAWGWEDIVSKLFFMMQWTAQRRSYEMHYPDAIHDIIFFNELPVGRIMIDSGKEKIILIDISILPQFYNQGIGSRTIQNLQSEALQAAKSIHLSVLKNNPAKRLYERLGFTVISDNGLYESMEWRKV